MDVSAYHAQLIALSPEGLAWNTENGSEYSNLLYVFANALARIDHQVTDIFLRELDPRTATYLLADWEKLLGIPDACFLPDHDNLQHRREAAYAKWTMKGGQSKAYFLRIATAMGYSITIDTYRPFICGVSRCGEALNGVGMRFVWRVNVPGKRIYYFRTGQSSCADRLLTIISVKELECVFRRLKPAHTTLFLSYS